MDRAKQLTYQGTDIRNIMTKKEFQSYALTANLTADHNISGLAIPTGRKRSVMTQDFADNWRGLVASGQFDATEYVNTKEPQSPTYVAVQITDPKYNVVGSGVPKNTTVPDFPKDIVPFYSGTKQAWHFCAEDSRRIEERVRSGELKLVGKLVD